MVMYVTYRSRGFAVSGTEKSSELPSRALGGTRERQAARTWQRAQATTSDYALSDSESEKSVMQMSYRDELERSACRKEERRPKKARDRVMHVTPEAEGRRQLSCQLVSLERIGALKSTRLHVEAHSFRGLCRSIGRLSVLQSQRAQHALAAQAVLSGKAVPAWLILRTMTACLIPSAVSARERQQGLPEVVITPLPRRCSSIRLSYNHSALQLASRWLLCSPPFLEPQMK